MRMVHAQVGGRLEKSAIAVLLTVLVLLGPAPVRAHDDPPGDKITDFATVDEVWTDQSWDDGFILSDAELCIAWKAWGTPRLAPYSLKLEMKPASEPKAARPRRPLPWPRTRSPPSPPPRPAAPRQA